MHGYEGYTLPTESNLLYTTNTCLNERWVPLYIPTRPTMCRLSTQYPVYIHTCIRWSWDKPLPIVARDIHTHTNIRWSSFSHTVPFLHTPHRILSCKQNPTQPGGLDRESSGTPLRFTRPQLPHASAEPFRRPDFWEYGLGIRAGIRRGI